MPTRGPSGYVNLSAYFMVTATGGTDRDFGVPIKKTHTEQSDTYWTPELGETNQGGKSLKTDLDFLYDPKNGICMQGVGKLTNLNLYVYCAYPANWASGEKPDYVTFGVSPALFPRVEAFKTVARCPTSSRFSDGDVLRIPDLTGITGNDIYIVRSVGYGLCNSDSLDVYIGEGNPTGTRWNIYHDIVALDNDKVPFQYLVHH